MGGARESRFVVIKVGSLAAAFIFVNLITIIDEFKLDLSEYLTNKNSRKF